MKRVNSIIHHWNKNIIRNFVQLCHSFGNRSSFLLGPILPICQLYFSKANGPQKARNDTGATHLTFRIRQHLYQSSSESDSEHELELQPLKQPRGTKDITAVSLGTMGELTGQLLHGQDGAQYRVTPPPCSIPSTQDLQKLSRTREAFISSVLKDGTIIKLLQQSPVRWLTSPDIHKGGSRFMLGLPSPPISDTFHRIS